MNVNPAVEKVLPFHIFDETDGPIGRDDSVESSFERDWFLISLSISELSIIPL